jgi:hypothetical protein
MSNFKAREENLGHYEIKLSGFLHELESSLTPKETVFAENLVNVLQAYDQMKDCPCGECTENFVARARHLFHAR